MAPWPHGPMAHPIGCPTDAWPRADPAPDPARPRRQPKERPQENETDLPVAIENGPFIADLC